MFVWKLIATFISQFGLLSCNYSSYLTIVIFFAVLRKKSELQELHNCRTVRLKKKLQLPFFIQLQKKKKKKKKKTLDEPWDANLEFWEKSQNYKM